MSETTDASYSPLNGWEANAPEDDTILRKFLLAQAAYQRAAGEAIDAAIWETERFVAVDTRRPASTFNFGLLRQPLAGQALDETMAELGAFFGQQDATGSVALYCPLPTPDLSPWGWQLGGHPRLELRSPCIPLVDAPDVRIERVRSTDNQDTFERVLIEGFTLDEMQGAAAGSLIGAPLLEHPSFYAWLAYWNDAPAAAACSFVHDRIVNITMVTTLPEARRKGLGLAITQVALLPELGLPAILFSSDDGRPLYERLGFVPIVLVPGSVGCHDGKRMPLNERFLHSACGLRSERRGWATQVAWVVLVKLRRSHNGLCSANPQFCRCIGARNGGLWWCESGHGARKETGAAVKGSRSRIHYMRRATPGPTFTLMDARRI